MKFLKNLWKIKHYFKDVYLILFLCRANPILAISRSFNSVTIALWCFASQAKILFKTYFCAQTKLYIRRLRVIALRDFKMLYYAVGGSFEVSRKSSSIFFCRSVGGGHRYRHRHHHRRFCGIEIRKECFPSADWNMTRTRDGNWNFKWKTNKLERASCCGGGVLEKINIIPF